MAAVAVVVVVVVIVIVVVVVVVEAVSQIKQQNHIPKEELNIEPKLQSYRLLRN